MSLYLMMLKRNHKSLWLWSISVSSMVFLVIVLYPFVKDVYAAMPEEIMVILEQFGGIPEDALEYYATEGAMMLQLFGAIYAAMLGFGLISAVEKEKTAEMLYTQGVSKKRFHLANMITLLTLVILFSCIQAMVGFFGFMLINENINIGHYLYFQLLNAFMYLVMGLIGYLLAVSLKPVMKQMVALIVPLPLYIITIISSLTNEDWLKNLKHISPFTFSDPVVILKEQVGIDLISLYVYIGLSLIIVVSTYFIYRKRIHLL